MSDRRIRDRLRSAPVPREREAAERGWRVARAAFHARPTLGRRPRQRRWALVVAAGVLLLAIGLSPAGAKVVDLVRNALQLNQKNARSTLTSLPAPGRLLVTTRQGTWVVDQDGSKRLLGDYRDATWSPHGYYVAVTRRRSLTAVQPDGTVRWSLERSRPVSDPAWAPSGIRIAYLAGNSLHVVVANGTDDSVLEPQVKPTPPVWRPIEARNQLAFVDASGAVRLVDTESGRGLWQSARFGRAIKSLAWSADGSRLLVLGRTFYVVLDSHGKPIAKGPVAGSSEAAAFDPLGDRLAIAARRGGSSRLDLIRDRGQRELFSGPGRFAGLTWSPNGEWLLVQWQSADEWRFIRPSDGRVTAFSDISQQFNPSGQGRPSFPRVAGWCCAP